MNCPKCHITLTMSDRQGVEIDYCPQCRGVWLDRGELDKIIERAGVISAPPAGVAPGLPAGAVPPQRDYRREDDDDDDYRHRGHDGSYDPRRKKKKSFLSEIFDF